MEIQSNQLDERLLALAHDFQTRYDAIEAQVLALRPVTDALLSRLGHRRSRSSHPHTRSPPRDTSDPRDPRDPRASDPRANNIDNDPSISDLISCASHGIASNVPYLDWTISEYSPVGFSANVTGSNGSLAGNNTLGNGNPGGWWIGNAGGHTTLAQTSLGKLTCKHVVGTSPVSTKARPMDSDELMQHLAECAPPMPFLQNAVTQVHVAQVPVFSFDGPEMNESQSSVCATPCDSVEGTSDIIGGRRNSGSTDGFSHTAEPSSQTNSAFGNNPELDAPQILVNDELNNLTLDALPDAGKMTSACDPALVKIDVLSPPTKCAEDFQPNDPNWRSTLLRVGTKFERRASVITTAIASAVDNATATPKYNTKGSVLSDLELLVDDDQESQPQLAKSGSLPVSGGRNKRQVFKAGLNSMSEFSVDWDFGMSVIYVATLWLIPFAFGFALAIPGAFSAVVTTLFGLDTVISFTTLRTTNPAMQALKSPTLKDWQLHYLKHGLLIDVITTIPLEIISVPLAPASILWLIKLLRLYKLPQIMSVSPWYLKALKSLTTFFGIGHSVAVIFPLFFIFCAFLHLQSCALFFMARVYPSSDWDVISDTLPSLFDQYTWALYFAVGNTFPLSYKTRYSAEKWVVLVFVITGASIYASILGTISSLAMGVDASGRLFKQKLDEVHEYVRWKELGPATHQKLLKYYELKYRGKFFEESSLLHDMNDSLRMEIATHNCRQLISKVSFLRRDEHDGRDDLFIGRIAQALTTCYYVPGDVVFTQGEMANEMYFIMSGCVHVIVEEKRVATFKDGAFFGEISLMGNIPRTATVQAATATMLYKLTRDAFTAIVREFDDVKQKIDAIYADRMEKIRREEEMRKLKLLKGVSTSAHFLNRNENDGLDEEFQSRLSKLFKPILIKQGQVIFTRGEIGKEMYFISQGTVEVLIGPSNRNELSAGSFFGEIALIDNLPRSATVIAKTSCVLYKLTRTAYSSILTDFPSMKEKINVAYTARKKSK
ncbi:cyclic nucleotide-binding-like protein [Chytriomyces cf. hyalinus JEL632]|nr:cyclic nucleotide-binding-like protein [Chytriomyces cf. hyalinus JEL632]